jgi:outer membrane receptor for ferrienterochelin and colicins
MGRNAGTVGDHLGYRISAQYMRGTDWSYVDSGEVQARRDFLDDPANARVNPDTLKIGLRDSSIERLAGELRIDYLPTDELSLILSIGANDAIRNPDITGVGGAQARDWLYTYYQLRCNWKSLFAQIFYNKSDAGNSYLLQSGNPVVDRSSLFVSQLQNSWQPFDSVSITYGADLLVTTPVTDSTITGRNEGNDRIVEIGAYAQGDWSVIPERLQAVGALRVDNHSRLSDPIVSPRVALVYTPGTDQSFRVTYNSAYSAPTTNDMFLDVLVRHTPAVDIRASGLSESGFTFRLGSDGIPLVRSRFSDNPAQYLPLDSARSTEIWNNLIVVVNQALRDLGATDTLKDIAPPPSTMPLHIRTLNRATGAFDSSGFPRPVDGIRPTINRTIELGYKGVIADRLLLSIDAYRSHYTDFIGTLGAVTASVFYDYDALRRHFTSELIRTGFADSSLAAFYGDLLATQIAGRAGDSSATGAPVATISPEQASDPAAVFFAPRNFGSITLYGIDVAAHLAITPDLTLGIALSYVDKNFFPNLDNVGDLALNAPKFKYTLSAGYQNPVTGIYGSIAFRHVDGFPVESGVYIGTVAGYSVLDFDLGSRLPWVPGMNVTLSIQNLLTFVEGSGASPFTARHAEFVGTPSLGRLALLRATYEFH